MDYRIIFKRSTSDTGVIEAGGFTVYTEEVTGVELQDNEQKQGQLYFVKETDIINEGEMLKEYQNAASYTSIGGIVAKADHGLLPEDVGKQIEIFETDGTGKPYNGFITTIKAVTTENQFEVGAETGKDLPLDGTQVWYALRQYKKERKKVATYLPKDTIIAVLPTDIIKV